MSHKGFGALVLIGYILLGSQLAAAASTNDTLTRLTSEPIVLGDYDYNVTLLDSAMNIYWTVEGDIISIGMTAQANGWVGIGFNPSNGGMKNADMVLGWVDSNGISVNDYWSNDEVAPPLDTSKGGVDNILEYNGSNVDGITTIKFRRLLNTGDSLDATLTPGKMVIVYAFNPRTTKLEDHGYNRGRADIDFFTGEVSDVSSGADSLAALRIVHAVLMTVGWAVLVPIGIIIARYFHEYKWWFPVHIAIMTTAVIFIIVGFALGIIITDGGDFMQSEVIARAHAWLGLFVFILAVAQPVLGFIADRMWNPNRTYIPFFPDRLHWYVGRYATAGAYFNIILGMIYLDVWYGWWIIFSVGIFLEIVGFHLWSEWRQHRKRRDGEHKKSDQEKRPSTEMAPMHQRSSTTA